MNRFFTTGILFDFIQQISQATQSEREAIAEKELGNCLTIQERIAIRNFQHRQQVPYLKIAA